MEISRSDPGCAGARSYHVNTRLTLRFARDGLGTNSMAMHGRAIRSSSQSSAALAAFSKAVEVSTNGKLRNR